MQRRFNSASECKTKSDEAFCLLEGIRTGEYNVVGYTSEWPRRGPANQRKVTVTIEDLHFDKQGRRVKPEDWHGDKDRP